MVAGINKAKLFISENGRMTYLSLLAIGFLMVTASLAGVGPQTATVVDPQGETVVENKDPVTVSTNVTTTAVVENDVLWEEGTRLVDSPIYLVSATPEFTVKSRVTANPGGVRASQEIVLVTQAVKNGEVFWEDEEVIKATRSALTESGTVVEATMDARELNRQFKTVRDSLGGKGSVRTHLRLNVKYETGKYEGEIERKAGLSVDSDTYTVGSGLGTEIRRSTPVEKEVPEGPGLLRLGAVLLGFSLITSGAVVRRESKKEYDVEELRRKLQQDKYEEWISQATIPETRIGSELSPVPTESLEDLVDIAIDSKKRVIHDKKKDVYAVMDGTTIYYYQPKVPMESTDGEN